MNSTSGFASNFPWNPNTSHGSMLDTSSSRIEMQNASRSAVDATTKLIRPVSTIKLNNQASSSDVPSNGPRNTSHLTAPMELGESAIIHWPLPSNLNVTGAADGHNRSSADMISLKLSAPTEWLESPIIHWPLPSSNSNITGRPGLYSSERHSGQLNPSPSTVPTWCSISGSVVSGQAINTVAALRNENSESVPLIIAPGSNNLHRNGQQAQVETVPLNIGKIPLNTICKLRYEWLYLYCTY